ncbi:fusarin C cluster-translation elongation factor [Apiospora phragmitis]|uniref:Fusarin C cluster-translation elongation factor n=1 Tax=Apiospora phragmitis TaxID=2905665 RepID=A0ABR1VC30_9PEZI
MAPFGILYTLKERVHPRSRKVLAAAALNGLELEVPADFDAGVTNKTPEFLAKFPLGQIPTFESKSKSGSSGSGSFLLAESTAIAQHVADSGPRREQLLGRTAETRALNQQWILFNDLQFETTAKDLVAWRLGTEAYRAERETKAAADVRRWLDRYEGHLKSGDSGTGSPPGRAWFVNADAEGPSLADVVIGGTVFILYLAYMDAQMREEYPYVLRFYEGLKRVPELTELYTGPLLEKRKEPE